MTQNSKKYGCKVNFAREGIILAVLLVAMVLRFLYLRDTVQFGGDQADHLEFAQTLLVNHGYLWHGAKAFSKVCSGILTEVYLGPIYYYLLALPSVLAHWNPVGASVFNTILGALAIWPIYCLGQRLGDRKVGLAAAIFFGFSTAVIIFSRIIWNPYFLPLFVSLEYIALIEILRGQQKYLLLLALMIAITTQLHGLAFFFLPGIAVIWLIFRPRIKNKWLWLWSGLIILASYLPFIHHELERHFSNTRALLTIVFHGRLCGGEAASYLSNLPHTIKAYFDSVALTLSGQVYESVWNIWSSTRAENIFNFVIYLYLLLAFLLVVRALITRQADKIWLVPLVLIASYILGSNFFPANTYAYYYIALLPLTFAVLAYPLAQLAKNRLGALIVALAVGALVALNLFSFGRYVQDRVNRAQHRDYIFADLVLQDQLATVDYIAQDAQSRPVAIDYTSQYEGGAFRYINLYQYLIARTTIAVNDTSRIHYLIVVPKTSAVDLAGLGKILERREFGALAVIKYEK